MHFKKWKDQSLYLPPLTQTSIINPYLDITGCFVISSTRAILDIRLLSNLSSSVLRFDFEIYYATVFEQKRKLVLYFVQV